MAVLVMGMLVYAAAQLTSETAIAQNNVERDRRSIPGLEVAVHFSPATPDSGEADLEAIARETEDSLAGKIEQAVMAPTRSSFLAKWRPVRDATGYRLDVSTTPAFDFYVNRYRDLDVGNATSHIVSGLDRGTKYYYRVRPYSSAGMAARNHRGHAGPDRPFADFKFSFAPDQSGKADFNPGHVCNRVQLSRRSVEGNTEGTRTDPWFGRRR